jgi:acylphosphatase
VTKNLKIEGSVQGVGYRYSLLHTAQENGVTGWVRNRRDNSVEAVLQGEDVAVQRVIDWAKQGPTMARVDRVEVTDTSGHFVDFSIVETV